VNRNRFLFTIKRSISRGATMMYCPKLKLLLARFFHSRFTLLFPSPTWSVSWKL
jgi:hypothetical protein